MIRTTLTLAAAGLFLVACGPKPEEAAKPAEPAAAASPDATDADAAQKAMAAAAAAAMAGAGGGSPAQITNPQMKAFVETYGKVTEAVLAVKDEASAKAVGEKIAPLIPQLEAQSKAVEALPESERAAAAMQAAGPLMATVGKMTSHMLALPPDVQEVLSVELEKLPDPK
jgi:hypothetical protein